jgi:diguanylate cyclase (GGDEF)-like protein
MTAPLIATLVMVILNIFFPFLYTVDYETGTYARLNYMFFLFIPFLISFTAAIFVTLKYRKELSKYEFIGNIVSIAIAIVGVVLQYFDNGGYYIWPAIAISSIYLFLFSSVDSIFKDGLTGTNNRLKLIHYVHGAISKSYGNRKPMLAMMIDIDHFKNINDQYGHKEGDYALKVAADILKSVCTKNIFLSRYGGDEFIVLLFDKKHIENSDLKEEIVQKANEFNEKKIKPYTINFSIGEVLFNGDNPLYDYRMLLDTIDKKMYEEKRNPFR